MTSKLLAFTLSVKASHVGIRFTNKNNLFQTHMWIFKDMPPARNMNHRFSVPLEVLIAAPAIVIISNAMAPFDRILLFRLVYPLVVSTIGVLIPLYIIRKNDKMTKLLKQLVYNKLQCPNKFSSTFKRVFKMLRKYSVFPQPTPLNE